MTTKSETIAPAGGAPAAAIPWAPLAGIIATVAVFAIAQGLSYPLLSMVLERQGHSASAIGLSAAMMPIGLIASSALIPPLTRWIGPGALALICAASAAILFALIGWTQDLIAWYPLRFLVGTVIGPLYVLSEIWIIALSPAARRGRILGVYTSVISAGFAAGPVSMVIVGTEGWPPFLVGVFAFAACFVCLAVVLPRLPDMDDGGEPSSVRDFVPRAPVLLLCVLVAAACEQAIFSLLPLYGTAYGIGAREMSALIAVLVSGSIALQLPIGLAGERWGTRRALIACGAATAVGSFALPLVIGTPAMWPFVFVWGSLAFGVYTLSLAELGERFTGALLVAGNAAFALMWGFGGIAGPPAAGAMMDILGVEGLPLTLGAMCLGMTLVRIWRR